MSHLLTAPRPVSESSLTPLTPLIEPSVSSSSVLTTQSVDNVHRQRCVRRWRCLACVGFNRESRRHPPPHPLALHLAKEKRRTAPRALQYRKLVLHVEAQVPSHIANQIRLDCRRTFALLPQPRGFWGWPELSENADLQDREELLARVLLAREWRAVQKTSGVSSETRTTYVQGMNLLAAMCIGFVGGREQEGFWLFIHVLEDVLGSEYFLVWPPLLGYHIDCAVATSLISSEAQQIASYLGARGLAEVVSMLAARCFLSGYVGFLSDGPLLALWEDLLQVKNTVKIQRLPYLTYLLGLIRLVEKDLMALVGKGSDFDMVAPLLFQRVQSAARSAPDSWRPRCLVSESRFRDLRNVAENARMSHVRVNHAAAVSATLDRISNLMNP